MAPGLPGERAEKPRGGDPQRQGVGRVGRHGLGQASSEHAGLRFPPDRGGIEAYRGRIVVERSFKTVKQWRALATRYDKLAIVYRGAVLRAITIWPKHL